MIDYRNCLITPHAVLSASRTPFMEHYQQAQLRRNLSFLRAPRFGLSQSPKIKNAQIKSPRPAQPPTPTDSLTEALLDPFTTVGEAIVDSQLKSQQE
jgi:hypothetical protein